MFVVEGPGPGRTLVVERQRYHRTKYDQPIADQLEAFYEQKSYPSKDEFVFIARAVGLDPPKVRVNMFVFAASDLPRNYIA